MKIAIFGGTFDPIHDGHIGIIKKLIDIKMDKVIVIPTNIKYYKKNNVVSSYYERVEACKEALKDLNNVEVSLIEENISEDEGFADILAKLKEIYSNDELYTVVGSDSFNYLNKWRHYELIPKLSKIVVATRPNFAIDNNIGIDYIRLDVNYNISSTEIRNNLAKENKLWSI